MKQKIISLPPPLLLLLYLILAALVHFLLPAWRIFDYKNSSVGFLLIALGFAFIFPAWFLFWKKKTAIRPADTPRAFVTEGPYRASRNPMYLASVLILTGIALLAGSLPFFFLPGVFFITADKIYIPHEEKNMEMIFGEAYRDYKKRVRRWL